MSYYTEHEMDYVTVTPLLHVGTELPFEHVVVRESAEAARLMKEGTTVLVPSMICAVRTLRHFGLDEEYISDRITHACGFAEVT